MWLAFQGSADDEYNGPGDAGAEASATLAGRWGPVVWQASLAAEVKSALIAAVIIVLDDAHERLPLLAFAVTDPACQRRGIGRWLIEDSMHRLDLIGTKELHLAVIPGNPAMALYQRLGFVLVPGSQAPEASAHVEQPVHGKAAGEWHGQAEGSGPGMARSVSGGAPPPARTPEDHF